MTVIEDTAFEDVDIFEGVLAGVGHLDDELLVLLDVFLVRVLLITNLFRRRFDNRNIVPTHPGVKCVS